MLETWLREDRVRLPTLVMLETWLRVSGVPCLRNFLISSGNLYQIITLPFVNTSDSLVVFRTSTPACHA